MTSCELDPLAHVLGRVRPLMGELAAEDCALAVVTRFLTGGGPRWLHGRADVVRLDVLTVIDVLHRRRVC